MPNYHFPNASVALPILLDDLLQRGTQVESRNGGTRELLMSQITLENPIPAPLTTPQRRISLPAQIAETMWLLAGRNDIGWLTNYLPRAADFSDDGKTWRGGYGPRIRRWDAADTVGRVDQLAHVVAQLRENPDTRRAVMAIYDPAVDTFPGKDIPCNNWVHFIARDGKLHGHVAIRSNDVFWGWSGINTFEWASLLHIVAGMAGMETGSITYSISSLHLYARHEKRAAEIVQASQVRPQFPKTTPRFRATATGMTMQGLDDLVKRWFRVEALIRSTPNPSGQVRYEIERFPEPMMRSWLDVLYAWWHGDVELLLRDYEGTELHYAALHSPARKRAEEASASEVPPRAPTVTPGGFAEATAKLHAEKHKAYGNSWQRRGEMLAIMANLARKVDRLPSGGGAGETTADTAQDLLVYAIKYRLWLSENEDVLAPRAAYLPAEGPLTEDADYVTMVLASLGDEDPVADLPEAELVDSITLLFDNVLEPAVQEKLADRWRFVDNLIQWSHPLALRLWKREQWRAGNAKRVFSGYGEGQ